MATASSNSRFLNTPIVVDPATQIARYVEWETPFYGNEVQERLYVVTSVDLYRLDRIAHRVYGDPALWWVIMHYNNVADPFSLDVGDKLRIPSKATVNQILSKKLTTATQTLQVPKPPPVVAARPYVVPVYSRPLLPTETISTGGGTVVTASTLFVYGFQVPAGLSGLTHFQLVASGTPDFSTVLLNKFTLSSQSSWFYYNPSANAGSGGFVPFPATGLDGELYVGQTVYYNIGSSDGLTPGIEYFARFRTWNSNVEGPWAVSPPIIIPAS